ncbi:MAG: PAS domain S-box protein [Desulfomonile tiedjei]|nr:PAS domain S-box protein [Desulfomonile tiedjei]
MDDQKNVEIIVEYLEDEEDATFINRGLHAATETIDLQDMVRELDTACEESDNLGVQSTAFGKLLDALPLPALMVDRQHNVIFINQACEKISPDYKGVEGRPFSALFPDAVAADQVQTLVEKVFSIRQTQILEAVVKISDRPIWGRVHIRSLRWGGDPWLLILIEDLTIEKKQLALQRKLGQELKRRVEERTADLERINVRLQEEIGERSRAEEELRKHRHQLEELVIERTTELRETVKRLKQEVKDRKKAENSLSSSERRVMAAFRAYPGEVSIVSLSDGQYVEVNDSFCKASGYQREEIIGRTDDELRHWARPAYLEQLHQCLSEAGAVHDFEAVFRSKDGKMRVGSVAAEIIDLDDEPHVLLVTTDITESKRAERHHRRLTAALDHVTDSVVIADSRGAIKYVNPSFEAVSGFTHEEVVGKNVGFFRSRENELPALAEANSRVRDGLPWKGRLLNRRKDNSSYAVETTITPVRGQSDRTTDFVVVDRVPSSEAPSSTSSQPEEQGQSVEGLAGGIARDFGNVLMPMLGYTYLAAQTLSETGEERTFLEEVIKAGRRGQDLVEDIRALAGDLARQRRAVDFGTVVKEALGIVRASLPGSIEIRERFDDVAGSVLADPAQLRRMIVNLCIDIGEAIGGDRGLVSVSLTWEEFFNGDAFLAQHDEQSDGWLKLTISDNDRVIDPETLDRIFEPYSAPTPAGMGADLRLAVARGIARVHGGEITVQSDPGKGTTFTVRLPVYSSTAELESAGDETAEGEVERILLVDSDAQVAQMGTRVLTGLGFKVEAYSNVSEVLRTFINRHAEFDLVITDFSMPTTNGLELATQLMAIRPGIPVILCCGACEGPAPSEAEQFGIKALLTKPFHPSLLGKTVCKVLSENPLL